MSEEKNDGKPELTLEEFERQMKEALRQPTKAECTASTLTDEDIKRLKDKMEVEVTYRVGTRQYHSKAEFPLILITLKQKLGVALVAATVNCIEEDVRRMASFLDGYNTAKEEAAQKPATEPQGEATPTPSEKPDGGTGEARA